MIVIFSADALEDMSSILAYLAEQNPKAADRIGRRLVEAADKIAPSPHSGRRGLRDGTREIATVWDAICRALKALWRHGFLDWLRRWEPADNPGEAGPQVKQATNAYRLTLPPRAEKLLSLMEKANAPMPEDREAELQARKAAFLAMVDALAAGRAAAGLWR